MTPSPIRIAIAIFIVLSLQSCFRPFFYTEYAQGKKQVSFSSGKWLLNNITPSGKIQGELEAFTQKTLKQCLGNRLSFIDDVRSKVLVPNTAIADFRQDDLKLLNATTGFDYLVNISAEGIQANEGIDKLTGYPPLRTEMRIYIKIYELKSGSLIHYQIVHTYSDRMTQQLFKPDKKLLMPTLKRALKNLRKYSDCQ